MIDDHAMGQLEVGQLAQALYEGYLGYCAAGTVLADPGVQDVLRQIEARNRGPASVPIGTIPRSDRTEIAYHLLHAFKVIAQIPEHQDRYSKLWLAGALLTLGDALDAENYFDHGPDLELIRHLRNGVAHGNRFHFLDKAPMRPAHFTGPDRRVLPDGTTTPPGNVTTFEMSLALHGKRVLFDFMGPGDVCDLLLFVAWRLIRIGNGDPPMPLFAQRP